MARDGIRAELAAALQQANAGHGQLVLVTGEPGMGKTTLARDSAEQARRAGMVVRWAACWSGGATVAHSPWLTLLAGLGGAGDAALAALLGTEADDPAAATSARASAYALVGDAVAAAANEQPMLVVLDDLHWADAGTIALLEAVTTTLPTAAALIVGTYRDTDVLPGSPLTRLGASVDRLVLAGLSEAEVGRLLADTVGRAVDSEVTADVRARTGGNPFLVVQLGRLLAADPAALTGDVVLPAGARDVLRDRLTSLPGDAVDVLAAAAVLGSPFNVGELRELSGVANDDVLRALDRAAAARIVERAAGVGAWRFVHDLFRHASLDAMSNVDRARLHQRAAAVLVEADAEPAVIARHLVLASDGPSRDAAQWSLRASDRALAAMAWEEATLHAEQALASAPVGADGDDVRAPALLALGRSRLLAGDVDGAGRAFDSAAALARQLSSPSLLAAAALGFSLDLTGFEVRLFHQGQIDLLEAAARELEATELVALRSTVLARLSVALSLTAPSEQRLALATEAVALARAAGEPIVLARALAAHCDAIAGPDASEQREAESSEVVAIAEQEHDGPLELLGRRLRFVARLEQGDVAGAESDAAAFARRANAIGNPLYSWFVPLWRAQTALANGDIVNARQSVALAREIGATANSLNAPMLATVFDYLTAFRAGEYAQVTVEMEAFLTSNEELAQYLSSLGGPAIGYFHAGQHDKATLQLDRALAIGLDQMPWDAEWLPAMVTLLEAASYLRHPLVAELTTRLEPYAHRFAFEGIGAGLYGSSARFVAMGCSALGRHDDAVRYAEQALAASRGAGAMLVADAERTLGDCLDGRGDPGDADAAVAHHATADAIFAAAGRSHAVRGRVAESTPAPAADAVALTDDADADNELRREGDVWHVAFAGATAIVRHSKGIADLAVLLASPGRDVHVSELEHVPRESLGGRGGDALDRRAITAYKERLAELAEELDDAEVAHDLGRAEKLRVEYDALIEQLSGSLGLGGRSRVAGPDPVERLRKAVTARVRDSIRRIEGVHPALGRHLANSVRTGVYCSYRPEHDIVWRCETRSGAARA